MKKIAMIPTSFLPVPNVEGGAVEYLCTELLNGNEKFEDDDIVIDVYTKPSEKLNNLSYKKTNIIQVHIPIWITLYSRSYNLMNKILHRPNRKEPHNEALIRKYLQDDYDYIIFENCMYLYRDVYERTSYKNNLVFQLHNDLEPINFPLDISNFISNTASKYIFISNYLRDSISKNSNSCVLYNHIDFNRFTPSMTFEQQQNLRNKYRINKDDIVIMYTGRIDPLKGVYELVKSFSMIQNCKNIKLLIVGSCWYNIKSSSPYLDKITKVASVIKDKIVFTGYVNYESMPALYEISDILVVPSLCEEAFGLVVAEGMAMGLPIVATVSGAIPELLDPDGAFLLKKDENLIENITLSLKKLIGSPEKRIEMGRHNLMKVHDMNIDVKDYFSKFYSLISCKCKVKL